MGVAWRPLTAEKHKAAWIKLVLATYPHHATSILDLVELACVCPPPPPSTTVLNVASFWQQVPIQPSPFPAMQNLLHVPSQPSPFPAMQDLLHVPSQPFPPPVTFDQLFPSQAGDDHLLDIDGESSLLLEGGLSLNSVELDALLCLDEAGIF